MKSNAVKDVATKEELTRFFLGKTDHGFVLHTYLQLSGKPKGKYDMNDIFGDMFDRLDHEWEVKGEKDYICTFRTYLLSLLDNIKDENSDNNLAYVDLLRSPWLPVFMTIFALTGTGITFFIQLWLIKKSGENNETTQKFFNNCLQFGVMSIICNPLFVCSLIFGWPLWIQMAFGIIFASCELLSLFLAYESIANCYRTRKKSLSSAEYNDLLPKVENYFKQVKDDTENKEIKKEELKKEDENKPKEEVYEENKDKNGNDIPAGPGDK